MTKTPLESNEEQESHQGAHHCFCDCGRCEQREEGYFAYFKKMSAPDRLYHVCQILQKAEDDVRGLRADLLTLADSLK